MRKHVLVLTTTAAILASGVITASTQAPCAQPPSTQQSPITQPKGNVTCTACGRVHLINPKSGKVLEAAKSRPQRRVGGSGRLATLAAIRRASSRVSRLSRSTNQV
jgi:hypothetical protein